MPHARGLAILAMGVVVGWTVVAPASVWLDAPQVYFQDFAQEYLLAAAIRDRVDPYQPLSQLAARYLGSHPVAEALAPYPTPHPPSAGMFAIALTALRYESAAAVWLYLQLVWLFAAVFGLARTARIQLSVLECAGLTAALVAWDPIMANLYLGQLTTVVLLTIVLARHALLRGRPALAGVCLGVGLLIKPIAWPVLVVLTVRRQWSAILAMAATVAAGGSASALFIGPRLVVTYLTDVLPTLAGVYRTDPGNLSLLTLAARIFEGVGFGPGVPLRVEPLILAPALVSIASLVFVAVVVLALARLAWLSTSLDQALVAAVCASVVLNPLASALSLCLLLVPLAYVLEQWLRGRDAAQQWNVGVCVVGILLLPSAEWVGRAGSPGSVIPFSAGLWLLGPIVGTAALALLVVGRVPIRMYSER